MDYIKNLNLFISLGEKEKYLIYVDPSFSSITPSVPNIEDFINKAKEIAFKNLGQN
jgi:hypothetical protein